jgi:16S rRNA (guanine(966)-N(2))-methyltransferase RsmD
VRIISGSHKGTIIKAPGSLPVRPTTDTAKEGLFNILENRFELSECSTLDLFAGTGHISFEFCSRGAPRAEAVDRDAGCVKFIKEMQKKLQFPQLSVRQAQVNSFLKSTSGKYDIIFADPPYDMPDTGGIARLIFEHELLKKEGLLIIEHAKHLNLKSLPNFAFERAYGQSVFSFFKLPTE